MRAETKPAGRPANIAIVGPPERRWFWATLILSCVSIVALVFASWELVENRYFQDADYVTLHYLYITRGIASSLLLAFWAAWFVLRQKRQSEQELRQSREHYRGLLEASPGAVALYDASLRITEWNRTAEKLYGFAKEEVLGQVLPTVPPEKQEELQGFLHQVDADTAVLGVETVRRSRSGDRLDVELSLLPFREANEKKYFLEVASDIRERVRLRQKILEIEKLTSMGKIAAGTAHHLNSPLAAMLLRVQMMRERKERQASEKDLERLEQGIDFCRQFVSRLLEFSRRPPIERKSVGVAQTIESVVSFFSPSAMAKSARVRLDLKSADGEQVLADRNLLETLFSTLFNNALDAVERQGTISISAVKPSPGWIEVRVTDNGSGISPGDRRHVFEPFFTTKGPGKGTGLGLAIAKNIVTEHGGSIRLEPNTGRGTTVAVTLPLCTPNMEVAS